MNSSKVEILRSLLFENGAAMGVFLSEGGRLSGVVLEPSGTSFTYVQEDGSCHRQVSEYTKKDLLPRLAAVVAFRNLYYSRPFLCYRLHGGGGVAGGGIDRRRCSRLAQWPTGVNSRHCTLRADGSVEVRAAGGNARLCLSTLRTCVEVEFATSLPGDLAAAEEVLGRAGPWTSSGGPGEGDEVVWVTQRFLAPSAPKAFAHPLAVALGLSESPAGKREASSPEIKVAYDGTARLWEASDEAGEELIGTELPRPDDSSSSPRWDTVRQAHSAFDWIREKSYLSDDTGRAAARKIGAQSCMLGVDVITMARGQVYAGSQAATTESHGGCVYRIVDSYPSLHGGVKDAGVMVHVWIEADGSEVLLEGDFVRLRRPPAHPAAQPEERLLHVSATSTVRFCVNEARPHRRATTVSGASHIKAMKPSTDSSGNHERGDPLPAVTMSLGEITARSKAFLQQFMVWSRQRDWLGGSDGDSAPNGGMREEQRRVRPCTGVSFPRVPLSMDHPDVARRCGRPAISADVVERADRGGASFVLFADGRARGSFADRTIVTLPGTGALSPLHSPRKPLAATSVNNAGDTPRANLRCCSRDRGHIECILPEGTVVHQRDNFFPSGGAGGISPLKIARVGTSQEDRLKPYILAVRRFAEWALAEPSERRAVAERSDRIRRAAAIEAEKNRRFTTLRQLQIAAVGETGRARSLPGSSMRREVFQDPESRSLTLSSRRHSLSLSDLVGENQSGPGAAPSKISHEGETDGAGIGGYVGLSATLPTRARNELVDRMLRANQEAILRPRGRLSSSSGGVTRSSLR